MEPEPTTSENGHAVDRTARDRLADAIERALDGESTIDRFGREVWDLRHNVSSDPSIAAILEALDGIIEHAGHWRVRPLSAKYYSADALRKAQRMACFLRTDREYAWPPLDDFDSSAPDAIRLWAGVSCLAMPILGGYLVSSYDNFGLLQFIGVMALTFANALGSWWAAQALERKAVDAARRSHLAADREPAVWPYCKRDEVPSELADDFIAGTDAHAALPSLR